MAEVDEWRWITPAKFIEFAKAVDLSLDCIVCPTKFPEIFVDTVTSENLIPRSSTFGNSTETGNVTWSDSRHLPCVRVVCKKCGNVRLHSMYAVKAWETGGEYGA